MSLSLIDPDKIWFDRFPTRQTHIRNPVGDEMEAAFLSLGPHNIDRRRILLWKIPRGMKMGGTIQKIPFLAFSDENLEDEDNILLPILHDIMKDAADRYGVPKQ